MIENFPAEIVSSASKLRYIGRGRGRESPVRPDFSALCTLVQTHGRKRAQKLIKRADEICSLIADSLPPQEYEEFWGFASLRNRVLSRLSELFDDEVAGMQWSIEGILRLLNFKSGVVQDVLDNRWAPTPWTIYVSSFGRSRASVRPWRSKASKDRDLLDTWQFIDHEVVIAQRLVSRVSGETDGWVLLRVTKVSDFGRSTQTIESTMISSWKLGAEDVFADLDPTTQAWLDWVDRKTDEMPNL